MTEKFLNRIISQIAINQVQKNTEPSITEMIDSLLSEYPKLTMQYSEKLLYNGLHSLFAKALKGFQVDGLVVLGLFQSQFVLTKGLNLPDETKMGPLLRIEGILF